MRIDRGANVCFHFAYAPVSKHSLLKARQRCRDIFRLTSWGCVSAIDAQGRTIWIVDAHRDDGRRFVVRADELLTAFLELEVAIRVCGELV
jgi:hypothetical protein